jgi:hypothetical protein
LINGDYPELANVLGTASYEPETLFKLKNPILIWADKDWLKENGYTNLDRLSAKEESEILDALAWAMPVEGEGAGAYTDETMTFYSDYYGGLGVGRNRGSGRAASKGRIQIKGVGQTHMVDYRELGDKAHSDGLAELYEGIQEVLGSQIAYRELPYGANRVIALIATRTGSSVGKQRVLIVREDPLRPAHFIINTYSQETVRERERMNYVIGNLAKALPLPEGANPRTDEVRIRLGIQEMIERHARVAAYSYANHFLHGAFSASNEQLDSAALDFGAFLTLKGYPWAGRPGDNEMNGDTNAVEGVLREFIGSIRWWLPARLKAEVPTLRGAINRFRSAFDKHLRFELNRLTGAPPELMAGFQGTREFRELGDTLNELTRAGNDERFDALNDTLFRTDTYHLERILPAMANEVAAIRGPQRLDSLNERLEQALANEIEDSPLRGRFIRTYMAFVTRLAEVSRSQNIPFSHVQEYMTLAAKIRNKTAFPILAEYEDGRETDWFIKMKEFRSNKDPQPLRAAIQDSLRRSRRTYHDAKPLTLVLSESVEPNGDRTREVYNLRTGKTEIEGAPAIEKCAARAL